MENEFLPQGDMIRQLLTNTNISNSNITMLLREKGVFLGNSEKNISIPLLMKSIVSPSDFMELYETQKIKEDSVKFRTATIKCIEEVKLSDVFAQNIDLAQKIKDCHKYEPMYKLLGTPQFFFETDSAVFEYKIERTNVLEDWTNNKSIHSGAVYITKSKSGNLELSVEQNSTSKETVTLNEIVINEVRKMLENKKVIRDDDDFVKIRFNDFSNANRIQFLYSFTKKFCIYLDFLSITDIDLHLDENESSHADIKLFLDEIDSLKLNGKGLQNNVLLKNKMYHGKLIFASISLKYNFNIDGVKGTCTIMISFPDYIIKKSLNSEIQISINFTVNREHKKLATDAQLRKKIYNYIEKNKMTNYSSYKNI
jgi:hypothetical protein